MKHRQEIYERKKNGPRERRDGEKDLFSSFLGNPISTYRYTKVSTLTILSRTRGPRYFATPFLSSSSFVVARTIENREANVCTGLAGMANKRKPSEKNVQQKPRGRWSAHRPGISNPLKFTSQPFSRTLIARAVDTGI